MNGKSIFLQGQLEPLKAGIEDISQTGSHPVKVSGFRDPHEFGLIMIKILGLCQEICALGPAPKKRVAGESANLNLPGAYAIFVDS
jgi:hypothetical protein